MITDDISGSAPTERKTAGALFGDDSRLDPGGVLASALDRDPEESELKVWATMTPDRRKKAVLRLNALRRWTRARGEVTAAEAAEEADIAVTRFYEIAAAWQESPTLHSIGTLAKKPGRKGTRLDSKVVNLIQTALPQIVKDALGKTNTKLKISNLVDTLSSDPALRDAKLPHVNTLRTMIQREVRRQSGESQVGRRPGFDAIACDLVREDGTPYVIFGVIDRTSRLVLGFSLGDLNDSISAYARAAEDALDRIQRSDATLPWADGTERIDVIAGEDLEAWTTIQEQYDRSPVGPEFGIVRKTNKGKTPSWGRYFRLAAGGALGGMKIWLKKTGTNAKLDGGTAYTEEQAMAAIEVEIAKHNAQVMSENSTSGAARPAPQTVRILDYIASRTSRQD